MAETDFIVLSFVEIDTAAGAPVPDGDLICY